MGVLTIPLCLPFCLVCLLLFIDMPTALASKQPSCPRSRFGLNVQLHLSRFGLLRVNPSLPFYLFLFHLQVCLQLWLANSFLAHAVVLMRLQLALSRIGLPH